MAHLQEVLDGTPHYPSSSCIAAMVYDRESERLFLQFTGGNGGVYSGVPEDVVERLWRSGSKGKTYNREIKGRYSYTPE